MSGGNLTELQERVLAVLGGMEPPFVLSGGGALAGIYLGHRTTRDLDLFWRNQAELGNVPRIVEERLLADGLSISILRTSPAFVQLRVTDGPSVVIVDLIAEAGETLDAVATHRIGSADILVDSPRAILAEKLCALLERSEIRDLIDVQALVRIGVSLDAAIADAPRRDRGFSPLTLAWVLRDLDLTRMTSAAGLDETSAASLEAFRESLIERLVAPA